MACYGGLRLIHSVLSYQFVRRIDTMAIRVFISVYACAANGSSQSDCSARLMNEACRQQAQTEDMTGMSTQMNDVSATEQLLAQS